MVCQYGAHNPIFWLVSRGLPLSIHCITRRDVCPLLFPADWHAAEDRRSKYAITQICNYQQPLHVILALLHFTGTNVGKRRMKSTPQGLKKHSNYKKMIKLSILLRTNDYKPTLNIPLPMDVPLWVWLVYTTPLSPMTVRGTCDLSVPHTPASRVDTWLQRSVWVNDELTPRTGDQGKSLQCCWPVGVWGDQPNALLTTRKWRVYFEVLTKPTASPPNPLYQEMYLTRIFTRI